MTVWKIKDSEQNRLCAFVELQRRSEI